MNDQERQVISDIFSRLEQVAHQPRDPEAERFIAEKVSRQPYAPYAMAQAIYVQEQALTNLNQEVEELRHEVERLRSQPQGGGGFLASLFGGGQQREPERPVYGRAGGGGHLPAGPQGGPFDPQGGPSMGGMGGPQGGPCAAAQG
ncbi:MAG TPA: DUF2076 domain-containing protein, partial [Beijerinckiaceae bacterium]|nr:DUF2076 domain-containing protein [Beijerinckiaceae bacterium]